MRSSGRGRREQGGCSSPCWQGRCALTTYRCCSSTTTLPVAGYLHKQRTATQSEERQDYSIPSLRRYAKNKQGCSRRGDERTQTHHPPKYSTIRWLRLSCDANTAEAWGTCHTLLILTRQLKQQSVLRNFWSPLRPPPSVTARHPETPKRLMKTRNGSLERKTLLVLP